MLWLNQIRIFAPFLVTNTFRCVIGEFHHKIRFITISADIQSTTFKLRKSALVFHLKIINYHSLKMYFGGTIIPRGAAS